MNAIDELVSQFASAVWGLPLVILLIGGGFYLLILSNFLPFRYLGHSLDLLRGKYNNPNDPGEINHFQSLSTALSSTVGMGNIAGVAVAIALGGPGAIFWLWVSAVVGMATKFFTNTLAVMYRGRDTQGNIQGGVMYFIEEGLGKKWKFMAIFFSVAGTSALFFGLRSRSDIWIRNENARYMLRKNAARAKSIFMPNRL